MAELALVAAPIGAVEGAGAIAAGAAAAASTISIGTLLTGASIAWSIGSTLFSMFGPGSSATGPRLKDVHVQSAAFGAPMKTFWGTDRMAGEIIWASKIREHAQEQGGKGGGAGSITTFTYDVDVAVAVCKGPVKGVLRIWAGPKLIYDVSKSASFETVVASAIQLKGKIGKFFFYDGAEDQLPPATIEAAVGVGNSPAYRGQCVIVFKNFRLANFGNQIPQFSFEVFQDGDESFVNLGSYPPLLSGNWRAAWGYVDENGEVYGLWGDEAAIDPQYVDPAFHLFHFAPAGSVDEPKPPDGSIAEGVLNVGDRRFRSDESSFVGWNGNVHAENLIAYFSVATGGQLYFDLNAAVQAFLGDPAALTPHIFVKSGTDYYVAVNTFFVVTGDENKHWIFKLSAGSDILASTQAMFALGGIVDLARSDSYVWALSGSTPPVLAKFDKDSLDLLDTFTLTGADDALAICAEDDSTIDVFGTGSSSSFYRIDGDTGAVTTLATGISPGIGISSDPLYTLVVKNGLWYVGYNGFAGGDTTIYIFGPQTTVNCIPLWKIVRDICLSCGLQENEIDVTELTDCVHGYTLESQITGRDAILPLQRAYFFDGRESDALIDFIKRGHDSVQTIPQADMAARPSLGDDLPDVIQATRGQETELPVRIHVRFKDQDASYQTGHAYSSRLTSESKNVLAVDVPVAMTAQLAQRAAWVLMATHWLEREPKEIRISRKYLPLDAADPITLEVDS